MFLDCLSDKSCWSFPIDTIGRTERRVNVISSAPFKLEGIVIVGPWTRTWVKIKLKFGVEF